MLYVCPTTHRHLVLIICMWHRPPVSHTYCGVVRWRLHVQMYCVVVLSSRPCSFAGGWWWAKHQGPGLIHRHQRTTLQLCACPVSGRHIMLHRVCLVNGSAAQHLPGMTAPSCCALSTRGSLTEPCMWSNHLQAHINRPPVIHDHV